MAMKMKHKNLWDAATTLIREKGVHLNAYI